MSKKKRKKRNNEKKEIGTFSEKEIRSRRSFPLKNTILIAVLLCVQIFLIIFAFVGVKAVPKDIINDYEITVEPQKDGSLALQYYFRWTAVDKTEELNWVDIGMPNGEFVVLEESLSENIDYVYEIENDGYVALRIFFKDSYRGGECFDFGFSVLQNNMLCKDANGYFYELIPSWFNEIPIEEYSFRWKISENITFSQCNSSYSEYLEWNGNLDCGEFVKMYVVYSPSEFNENAVTAKYIPFNSDFVYNKLDENVAAFRAMLILVALLIVFFEVHIIDSYVSYVRGTGFLRSNGQYIHIYGTLNPITARLNSQNAVMRNRHYGGRHGGFGSGGISGCACACACACAGGGRAGCSQKDTKEFTKENV